MLKRWYWAHLGMPLYRVWDFLFPVCVPLNFKMTDNIFEVPRRPFLWAWTVAGIRKLQLAYYRRRAKCPC